MVKNQFNSYHQSTSTGWKCNNKDVKVGHLQGKKTDCDALIELPTDCEKYDIIWKLFSGVEWQILRFVLECPWRTFIWNKVLLVWSSLILLTSMLMTSIGEGAKFWGTKWSFLDNICDPSKKLSIHQIFSIASHIGSW